MGHMGPLTLPPVEVTLPPPPLALPPVEVQVVGVMTAPSSGLVLATCIYLDERKIGS